MRVRSRRITKCRCELPAGTSCCRPPCSWAQSGSSRSSCLESYALSPLFQSKFTKSLFQEQWTYLQGIYFSIVTFLTVGFGDFVPTKTASKVVLFPFALVGIVQLASVIGLIIRFFRERMASHNVERRHAFQRKRHEEESRLQEEPSLENELAFLRELYKETTQSKTIQDLASSVMGFLTFWVLGALIFSQIEVSTSP